jgi:hypothetical protein
VITCVAAPTTYALLLATVSGASAQYIQTNPYGMGTGSNPNTHYVQLHVTQQGTYVAPHYQTNPDSTQMDDYGTRRGFLSASDPKRASAPKSRRLQSDIV